jgi:integrase
LNGPLDQILAKKKHHQKGHKSVHADQLVPFYERLKAYRYKARQSIHGVTEQIPDGECLNGLLTRFILLTTARCGQARQARWDLIDFDAKTWTSPGIVTKTLKKTGQAHVIYLNAPALQLLKDLRARQQAEGSYQADGYVFVYGDMDVPRMGQQMFGQAIGRLDDKRADTQSIKFLQNTMQRKDLTLHGFRDSFGSWMELHYPQYDMAIELCLGHAVGSKVRRSYRRHGAVNPPKSLEPAEAERQQRFLMDAWGELFEPTKVADQTGKVLQFPKAS